MKAIIIAAGRGSRCGEFTHDRPKCLLPVGGKTLLDHQLDSLRLCGVTDITIVKGYLAEKIDRPGTTTRLNDEYANNNILCSLFYAEDQLQGDVIVSYSDIFYGPRVVTELL